MKTEITEQDTTFPPELEITPGSIPSEDLLLRDGQSAPNLPPDPAEVEDFALRALTESVALRTPQRPADGSGAAPLLPVPEAELLDKRRASWNWLLNETARLPLPEVARKEVSLWDRLMQSSKGWLEDLAQIQVLRGQSLVLNRPALAFAREGSVETSTVQLPDTLCAGDRLKVTMTMPQAGALVVLQRAGESVSLVYPPNEAYAVARKKDEQVVLPGKLEGEAGEEQELAILVVELELARLLAGRPAHEVVSRLETCSDLRMRSYRWRLQG